MSGFPFEPKSPLDTLVIAICIGTSIHLCISLLMLLKNIGARVYVVIQLLGVWYLLPATAQVELIERVRQVAELMSWSGQFAYDAAFKYYTPAASPRAPDGPCFTP